MTRRLQLLLILALVVLVGVIPPARRALVTGTFLLATGQLAQFQHLLQSLGGWAPVVSITLMVTESALIPVPATIVMVANGLVFGLWRGMLVSLAGGMLGSLVAYGLGRRFGRPLAERMLPPPSLGLADWLMERHGRLALLLGRWIPGVPGDPLSYAAGLTRMPLMSFLVLTALALVPANLVTAYLGVNVAGDVPVRYWLTGLAVIGAVWLIWRAARRRPPVH